jgi:outer membrane biosynthesis protein TonB
MLLQRDFLVPGTIPQSERVGLRVGVSVVIGPDRHFRSIEITEPSGHEAFDRAVATHVASLLSARPRLPVVPREFRTRIVGVPITVSFEPPPPRVPASTAPAAEH